MKKLVIFVLIFGFLFSSVNLFADETFEGDNWNDSTTGLTKNIEKSDEKPEVVKNPPKEEIDAVSGEAEVLTEKCPAKLVRMGINDCFGKSGSASELLKYFGLTSKEIIENVKK